MVHTKNHKRKFLYLVGLLASAAYIFAAFLPVSAAPAGTCTYSGTASSFSCSEAQGVTFPGGSAADPAKCYSISSASAGATASEIDCASFDAEQDSDKLNPLLTGSKEGQHQCGAGSSTVTIFFNIGCRGGSAEFAGKELNPIVDMLFAIFRFLSVGVGVVVIGSIVVAGIQYSTSRGNPQASAAAIKRIASALGALLLYIFIFAIANYLIPGGVLG